MRIFFLSLISLFALPYATAEEPEASAAQRFAISAQPLSTALRQYADQTGEQVVFFSEIGKDQQSTEVNGTYTHDEALSKLLKNTGLTYERMSPNTIAITRPSSKTALSSSRNGKGTAGPMRLAQNEPSSPGDGRRAGDERTQEGSQKNPESPPKDSKNEELSEVVVTGTHIRGTQPASPLTIVTREYIEKSGYSTLHDVLQTLPQNFGGGDTEATHNSLGGSTGNIAYGSSVNLRGLGSGSTLVLLNGRRMAPAAEGQFVDISLIPLSAVERVEVLADGASATYGSDAVGGVVNIILRGDYEGAETFLKGGSGRGALNEYQLSQTFGHSWDSGHALVSYEWFKRSNLDANERDYSAGVADPYDLLPQQKRQSVLASTQWEVSDRVGLQGSLLASERDAVQHVFFGQPETDVSTTRQLSGTLGATFDVTESWQASIAGLYSLAKTRVGSITSIGTRSSHRESDIESVDAELNGAAFELAGGSAKLAFGGTFRQEAFHSETSAGPFDADRNVSAVFGEIALPFVSSRNARRGLQLFEVTLAARYEKYSDFGDTTDPKLGVVWSPAEGLTLRGTYGTSFKAPIFSNLDETFNAVILFDLPDPTAPDGTTLTMWANGNNAHLKPETATTWTTGIDLQPAALAGFNASLTYFETRYKDRIVTPLPELELLGIFAQEDVYRSIISRDPTPAQVLELQNRYPGGFSNFYGPFEPEEVGALVDQRLKNLSEETVRGLDFSTAYAMRTGSGEWSFQLAATRLFEFSDAVTSTAPLNDVLGTAYHQAKLKARGGVSWGLNSWSVSGILNYTDGFTNTTVLPSAGVASWTTVDLQAAYDVQGHAGWLRDARIALSVINSLDKDPPPISSPLTSFDIGYDPTNANPLGRFVSLSARKRW